MILCVKRDVLDSRPWMREEGAFLTLASLAFSERKAAHPLRTFQEFVTSGNRRIALRRSSVERCVGRFFTARPSENRRCKNLVLTWQT